MSGPSGFEFLHRPYPYPREPFRLAVSERVGYEGRYFSIPAFGLLLDKRLFTAAASHPVASPIKLYINKDAGLSSGIEPSLSASGYEVATPHYADYIIDMRDLLDDVVALHAADSEFSADEFFATHMQRNRATYDLLNSSASGVTDLEYVHPTPIGTVPVAPSSTTIPGNLIELGAQQFQDIDMDEVMWQPFTRPKSLRVGPSNIPLEPIFPVVLPGGSLPEFSDLDKQNFGKLGFDAATSGGVIVTGDALVEGTTIKLLTGSGQTGAAEGAFIRNVPWKLFPAGGELNRYYETQSSGCINASGRQAVYSIPGGLADDTVYLLDVSSAGSSGYLIQNYPANFHSSESGIDPNYKAHPGVHVEDRLLYSLNEISANNVAVGRSLINGKKLFGHYVGNEVNSKGQNVTSTLKYADGDTVYAFRGVITPFASSTTSEVSWGTLNKLLSPVTWGSLFTSSLQPRIGLFGAPASTTWTVGDVMRADDGNVWFKAYAQWGTMDRLVIPASPRAGGGEALQDTINYETHVFREGTDGMGNFAWIELDPPESPIFTTQTVKYFADTYDIGNIWSFFFARNLKHGFVHVNGQTFIQWSQILGNGTQPLPRYNQFAPVSSLSRSTKKTPATSYSASTYVVGFFPSWKIRLNVTTNNQIDIPDKVPLSPAGSSTITMASGLLLSIGNVSSFGPAVWDSETGLNYLYVLDTLGRTYFAKMNTSFQIIHLNRVDSTDAILNGRSAILSL